MANLIRPWVFLGFVIVVSMKQTLGAPVVPCYFSFGDSLVDNGNNNNLATAAKANYLPYGVDFPGGATGRFTNNRTLADFFALLLGFSELIPPFATATGPTILKGVNHGSGIAGIRGETGYIAGDRISLDRQLLNHGTIVLRIARLLPRRTSVQQYLNKCLYTVVIGSNDYLNNYFQPMFYATSTLYTPQQYADALIKQFSKQLKILYKFGAWKIVLFGLGDLGCIPAVTNGTTTCVAAVNNAVKLFNTGLRALVDDLNGKLPDAKFIYINSTSIQNRVTPSLGFRFLTQPCCPVSSTGQCIPDGTPCRNRSQYAFFDLFHRPDNFYKAFTTRAYTTPLRTEAYPMNIDQLARS